MGEADSGLLSTSLWCLIYSFPPFIKVNSFQCGYGCSHACQLIGMNINNNLSSFKLRGFCFVCIVLYSRNDRYG